MVGMGGSSQSGGAQHVGGARTSVSRRRLGGSSSGTGSSSGSTRPRAAAAASQGIMRFYTEDAPGLKIGPAAVLIMAFCFMGSVVLLHIVAKVSLAFSGSD